MRITLTTGLSAEEMTPLWPQIGACFAKYVERFDDETIENMYNQCAAGRRQLWVIQDDDDRVILAPITEITTIDATGDKVFTCAEIGGERLQDAMHLLPEMEKWAAEQGCTEFELIGRKGWEKLLKPYDYEPKATIYRKKIHG